MPCTARDHAPRGDGALNPPPPRIHDPRKPDDVSAEFKNHDIVDDISKPGVRYEKRPARRPDGSEVPGLYNAWITLDNPGQFNSYTTDMVKGVILAFRAASNAATSTAWSSPASATRPSAPAATPRNTPSTTPASRRNTASTCGCSTTWSAPSWPATSR
jgi:hypothetical protein